MTLNTRRSKWDLKKGMLTKKNGRHIIPNLNNENLCQANRPIFGHFFCGFHNFLRTSLKFWHKCHTCLESSGNEDSYATFPKFLGLTSKCPDFCDGRGTEVWPIAESLSYLLIGPAFVKQNVWEKNKIIKKLIVARLICKPIGRGKNIKLILIHTF